MHVCILCLRPYNICTRQPCRGWGESRNRDTTTKPLTTFAQQMVWWELTYGTMVTWTTVLTVSILRQVGWTKGYRKKKNNGETKTRKGDGGRRVRHAQHTRTRWLFQTSLSDTVKFLVSRGQTRTAGLAAKLGGLCSSDTKPTGLRLKRSENLVSSQSGIGVFIVILSR
jgi:hypothetical protein